MRMPLVDIERFIPKMRRYVRSVTDPTAEEFIREAAREFCRGTRIWVDTITVKVTDSLYQTACHTADAEIVNIEGARLDGCELKPKTPQQLDTLYPDWADETKEPGIARFITMMGSNALVLAPRQAGTLRARLELMPAQDALSLPEILLNEHSETIGKGAAARALEVPETTYYDPNLAAAYFDYAEQKTSDQKWRTARTKADAPLRTTPRFF